MKKLLFFFAFLVLSCHSNEPTTDPKMEEIMSLIIGKWTMASKDCDALLLQESQGDTIHWPVNFEIDKSYNAVVLGSCKKNSNAGVFKMDWTGVCTKCSSDYSTYYGFDLQAIYAQNYNTSYLIKSIDSKSLQVIPYDYSSSIVGLPIIYYTGYTLLRTNP